MGVRLLPTKKPKGLPHVEDPKGIRVVWKDSKFWRLSRVWKRCLASYWRLVGRLGLGSFRLKYNVMLHADAESRGTNRHTNALAVALLDLAAPVDGLVDSYVHQMQRRAGLPESIFGGTPVFFLGDIVAIDGVADSGGTTVAGGMSIFVGSTQVGSNKTGAIEWVEAGSIDEDPSHFGVKRAGYD